MPPVALALTLVEKLYAIHNIINLVPVKLDLDELNYSSWRYFFMINCNNFNVLKHIEPKTNDASTSTPPTEEWLTADSIVKSWIILTLSPSLQKWFIKINPKTARDAWERVEKLFQDNKRTGTDDVVTYAINGLSHKYKSLAQIIAHKDLMRSMVSTEEMRLWSKSPIQPTNMTASAPQVLLATSNIPRGGDNHNTRNRDNRKPNTSTVVCRNFGRGFCRWGDSCRFVHNSNHGIGFWTRQILLRCDSTGDLYPVTSPSYPKAFLVLNVQYFWKCEDSYRRILSSKSSFPQLQLGIIIPENLKTLDKGFYPPSLNFLSFNWES
nr:hypothetical protein [Tanacetum cinerariifolium]